jgi:hypothetical protein
VADHETDVFSQIVFSAEKVGKPVKLLAIAGNDPARALLEAAIALQASDVWLGSSRTRSLENQEAQLRESWQSSAHFRKSLSISLVVTKEEEPKQLTFVG